MDFIQKTIQENKYSESAKKIIFHTFKEICQRQHGVFFDLSESDYNIKADNEEQWDIICEKIIAALREEGF